MQFNGDILSTMQAQYADGSNAGPANWTSYQKYSTAFAVDYTNNDVPLTPAFFGSLTDGAKVTLMLSATAEFPWSGLAAVAAPATAAPHHAASTQNRCQSPTQPPTG